MQTTFRMSATSSINKTIKKKSNSQNGLPVNIAGSSGRYRLAYLLHKNIKTA